MPDFDPLSVDERAQEFFKELLRLALTSTDPSEMKPQSPREADDADL